MNGKNVLITGGTGSFGRRFVKTLFNEYPDIGRVVIFSRDENKQYEMAQEYPESLFPNIRFFIGDVRDLNRLKRACEGIDVIVHAAAMKHVTIAEYNPMECISTNVLGAENVINAALDCGALKVVALSTDKACAPINLYGATKLCSDKLFIAANEIKGKRKIVFSVVRYGNVLGSRGSVIPFFLKQAKTGILPITDISMTRFNITLDEGVKMVLFALNNAQGRELFIPKIPSYRIMDVAAAVDDSSKTEIIGIRPGEKLHEEMITETDSLNTYDCGKYYVINSQASPKWISQFGAKKVKQGFRYNSLENDKWLTVAELKTLIRQELL